MRITDILRPELVLPALDSEDKASTLREFSRALAERLEGAHTTESTIEAALAAREKLGSTGVGEGVAIPHTKLPGLTSLVAAFGRSKKGIAFDAIDNQPVRLVFVLLVPEDSAGAHLKALARISRLLKDNDFRRSLLDGTDRESLYEAFVARDAAS